MNSVNKVQILGNCTADPEIRETQSGQKVATINLATNRVWKDESGQKQERTEFHTLVAWRGLAEVLEKYVKKGNKIYADGYLQTRSWEAEDGTKRYKTEIVVEDLVMLSAKKDPAPDPEDSEAPPAKKSGKKPKDDDGIHIEDIPF